MTTSGSVVGEPVLLLSLLASIDLLNSSLINVASVARAGLRPAFRHPSDAGRAPSHPLHRDFHFGLSGPVQYTPSRRSLPSARRATRCNPSPSPVARRA